MLYLICMKMNFIKKIISCCYYVSIFGMLISSYYEQENNFFKNILQGKLNLTFRTK